MLATEQARGLTIPDRTAAAARAYAEVLRWVLEHGAEAPSDRVVRNWRESFHR